MQTCTFHSKCHKLYGVDCNAQFLQEGCVIQNNTPIQTKGNLHEGKRKLTADLEDVSITCPRCMRTHAYIHGACGNEDCNFNTKKLSYNCFLIHCNLFYADVDIPNRKVMEIATGLSERSFSRLLELSIFMMRAATIIVKYLTEYADVRSTRLSFYTKQIKKIMKSQRFDGICGTCGTPQAVEKHCKCVTDAELRNARLQFQTNWKNTISKPRYGEDAISVLHTTPKQIVKVFGDDIHTLRFTRYLLSLVKVDDTRFIDLPFGYVYHAYSQLFSEASWKTSENLGLTDPLYDKAIQLYCIGD